MKIEIKKTLMLLLIISPLLLNATHARVVLSKTACSHYLIEEKLGFAIIEWFGGNEPKEGNILVGDFSSKGMRTLNNISANVETKAWIEDYNLKKDIALLEYYDICNVKI